MAPAIELLRPRQWLKNLFVLAPLLFALQLTNPSSILQALGAAAAFCLGASAVYTVNDIADRRRDAAHPRKKNRPIARGAVPVGAAAVEAVMLFAAATTLSLVVSVGVAVVLAVYIGLNLAYSFFLKRFALVDILVIAVGFVLRVEAGATAIAVGSSRWIILSTLFLALFLALGKRRGELAALEDADAHRPGSGLYSVRALDALLVATVALTVIAYALYTVDPQTVARLGTTLLVYTVPIVVYGLFRYYLLVVRDGEFADPTDLVAKDRGIVVCVGVWAIAVGLVLYLPGVLSP